MRERSVFDPIFLNPIENHAAEGFAVRKPYCGSPDFAVEGTRFGGESVRTHTLTPKSGYLSRKFPESSYCPGRLDQRGAS